MKKEETIVALIEKAAKSLEVAKKLSSDKYYDFSISRGYYTMFYCIQALLFSKDMSFSKHSAVISAFGREFVKTGIFPIEFQKHLTTAFEERLKSDYQITLQPSRELCEVILERAEEFLKETKRYLGIK